MHAIEFNANYAGVSKVPLAFGGFGKVYKVSPRNDAQNTIALKVVNIKNIVSRYTKGTSVMEDPELKQEVVKSVLNEAEIMRTLDHENIVKLIDSYVETNDNGNSDAFENYNNLYLMMEYSPYGSLHKFIKSRRNLQLNELCIPEIIASSITSQLLQALKYLTDEGIIHGDVKSANVLIFPKGRVKLCDFGLSFKWDDTSKDDYNDAVFNFAEEEKNKRRLQKIAVNGSAYWLAPEIVLHKMASPKSDIWSLGATVIEMLTGTPPFGELGALQACHKVGSGCKIEYPVGISGACQSFLDACFQFNPTQRFRAKRLISCSWVKHANANALIGFDGLYDNDLLEDLDDEDQCLGETKLAKLKDLHLKADKKARLYEYKEDEYEENYDDLELDLSQFSTRDKSVSDLQTETNEDDFEQLDRHYTVQVITAINTHNVSKLQELLRKGDLYLRQRPEQLRELCLQGLLLELAVAKRNGLPVASCIEALCATICKTLGPRGREWLFITGLLPFGSDFAVNGA